MKTIDLKQIKIKRGRRVFKEDVSDLVDSIKEVGLINPITVDGDYNLIAGWRRLKACKDLGWDKVSICVLAGIDAIDAEIAEIDENLIRYEMTALERGEILVARKQLYEKKYPETRQGATPGAGRGKGKVAVTKRQGLPSSKPPTPTFTKEVADKTGRGERSVREEIEIISKLDPEVRDLVRSTPLADNKTALKKLGNLGTKTKKQDPKTNKSKTEWKPNKEAQLKKAKALISGSSKTSAQPSDYNEADEWYTPQWVVDSARTVMGAIDLDPASSAAANKGVKAKEYYTIQDNGLKLEWNGRVFLNPPFSKYKDFVKGLRTEFDEGRCTEAILLVNNSTETAWCQELIECGYLMCLPKKRMDFWNPDRDSLTGRNGQILFYLGENEEQFIKVFKKEGVFVRKV